MCDIFMIIFAAETLIGSMGIINEINDSSSHCHELQVSQNGEIMKAQH